MSRKPGRPEIEYTVTANGPKGEFTMEFTHDEWMDLDSKVGIRKALDMLRRQAGLEA